MILVLQVVFSNKLSIGRNVFFFRKERKKKKEPGTVSDKGSIQIESHFSNGAFPVKSFPFWQNGIHFMKQSPFKSTAARRKKKKKKKKNVNVLVWDSFFLSFVAIMLTIRRIKCCTRDIRNGSSPTGTNF